MAAPARKMLPDGFFRHLDYARYFAHAVAFHIIKEYRGALAFGNAVEGGVEGLIAESVVGTLRRFGLGSVVESRSGAHGSSVAEESIEL